MLKKNEFMKVLVSLIVLAMLFSFAGCNSTDKDASQKQDSTATGSVTGNSTAEKKEPVNISVWASMGRFTADDRRDKIPYEKDIGYLEEKFGIKLNITQIPEQQQKDALKLMLSTNNLTDIIMASSTDDAKPGELFANGQIVPISKYSEQAANYMSLLDQYPALKKNVMDDKNNILYFCEPCIELELGFSGGLMIRRDWVEKLGLKMPETIDDWITVLKAFRDNDPNGNKQADEIPFVGSTGSLDTFANCFGLQKVFSMKGGGGGEVVFSPFEKDYKDRLKFMHTIYSEKLINQNCANMDSKMRDTWMLDDMAGSTLTGLGNMARWNEMMKEHATFLMWPVSNPTYNGIRYFDRGDITKMTRSNAGYVTTEAKNPEKCIEFLDFFFSQEGQLMDNFGVEGITYNMVNSFPKFTDLILKNPDGLTPSDAVLKYIGIPGTAKQQDMRVTAQLSLTDPASRQANMITWTGTFTENTNTSLPPAVMTPEESTEFADIMADINTYLDESVNKFMMGVISIDAEYDNFVAQLKKMGADRALEIQQAAVKRWQKQGGFDYKFVEKRADTSSWGQLEYITDKGKEYLDPSLK